jgi:hypothetical protein
VQDRYDELWRNWLRERSEIDEVEWLDTSRSRVGCKHR